MRNWFIAFLLFSSAPLLATDFIDFRLIEDRIVVSLSMMNRAAYLSQRNGFKFFQILSYGLYYNDQYYSFDSGEVEEGVDLVEERGDHFLVVRGYWGPSSDPKVIDSYLYLLSLEKIDPQVKGQLIQPNLF